MSSFLTKKMAKPDLTIPTFNLIEQTHTQFLDNFGDSHKTISSPFISYPDATDPRNLLATLTEKLSEKPFHTEYDQMSNKQISTHNLIIDLPGKKINQCMALSTYTLSDKTNIFFRVSTNIELMAKYKEKEIYKI